MLFIFQECRTISLSVSTPNMQEAKCKVVRPKSGDVQNNNIVSSTTAINISIQMSCIH